MNQLDSLYVRKAAEEMGLKKIERRQICYRSTFKSCLTKIGVFDSFVKGQHNLTIINVRSLKQLSILP